MIRRTFESTFVVLFLLTISTLFFGTILSEKKIISTSEKRQLALFPGFDWSSSSNKRFKKAFVEFKTKFEEYYRDHFFMREKMVSLYSLLKINLFSSAPNFMAIVGHNDWLFLVIDGELHDYLGKFSIPEDKLDSWSQVIDQRRQMLAEWGGHYLIAIPPNKTTIYPEYLPKRIKRNGAGVNELEVVSKYLANTNFAEYFLDLSSVIKNEKQSSQVYLKTDTHWTDRGAYVAYEEVIKRMQQWYPEVLPLSKERLQITKIHSSGGGDLALVIGLDGYLKEDVELLRVINPCAEQEQAYKPETLAKDYQLVKSGCAQASGVRVLIIGDSFLDSIRQYFSETFKEVVYSRETEFNDLKEFIRSYRPDIVIHLHVARFMDRARILDTTSN